MPISRRRSGIWATPFSIKARGGSPVRSSPRIRISPAAGGTRPVIASINSVWPLPATPAMPRISPRRNLKDMPATGALVSRPLGINSRTSMAGSSELTAGRSIYSGTVSPNVRRVNSSSSVSLIWQVPCILPSFSTVTRSETANTSRILCEIKTMPLPSSAIARKTTKS